MHSRKYDFLCFFDPKVTEEERNNLMTRFSDRITQNGGQIEKISSPMRRSIYCNYKKDKKLREAIFVQTSFSGPSTVPPILSELLRVTESVIRFVITHSVPSAPVASPEAQSVDKEKGSDQVEIAPEMLESFPEGNA